MKSVSSSECNDVYIVINVFLCHFKTEFLKCNDNTLQ